MTQSIRIVVADDSPFLRGVLSSYLGDKCFQIVGTAQNGREAVDQVQSLRPDVVTLDVDMPVMSGLEALDEIMCHTPTPVVMVSGVSRRSAEITLRAIQLGAVDFILKYVPGARVDPATLRLDVISKVRAAAGIRVVRRIRGELSVLATPKSPPPAIPIKRRSSTESSSVLSKSGGRWRRASHVPNNLVVIGASTGGPIAIRQFLESLPPDFAAPIIVVQHIPHPFAAVLAAQLHQQLPFTVQVAQGGESLEPGNIYLAPGDQHLLLDPSLTLEVHDGPLIDGHRPSIDVTMKSVAQNFPHALFGVLLTGMGRDGAGGMAFIKSRGGRTFAQNSETCVVDGMPASAIALGAVDYVASPPGIAEQLSIEIRRVATTLAARAETMAQT